MGEPCAAVHAVLASINQAWRENRPVAMHRFLDPGVTMVLPGFEKTVVGREALLVSYDEFCQNARVLEYRETEERIQVVSNCAVASFRFEMVYERSAYRARSAGRDLWVFERRHGDWLAVWRTMLELSETREPVKEMKGREPGDEPAGSLAPQGRATDGQGGASYVASASFTAPAT